jgi:hypothetical protein
MAYWLERSQYLMIEATYKIEGAEVNWLLGLGASWLVGLDHIFDDNLASPCRIGKVQNKTLEMFQAI